MDRVTNDRRGVTTGSPRIIAVIWALVASFIIIALPIWESKDQILAVVDGIFHTNLCEYYNPETSKQHKPHTAAAAAEPAKAAEPVS